MTTEQEALIPDGKAVYMNSPADSRDQGYRCAQDGTDIERCTCGFRESLQEAATELRSRTVVHERRGTVRDHTSLREGEER